jgi:hypothetical protein
MRNDIRNAPVFFPDFIKTIETNSKIQEYSARFFIKAEDDIAFLLNRGELVELVYKTSIIFINTDSVFLKMFSLFS